MIDHIQQLENGSLLSEFDIQLFQAGKHYHLYNKLGAHLAMDVEKEGIFFAVWAPNAKQVSLIGNFNGWNAKHHPMNPRLDGSGIWELFVPNLKQGELYKYEIASFQGYIVQKGDPYAFLWENPPQTSSVVWNTGFHWNDEQWMSKRKTVHPMQQALSIYEIHLGSWRRKGANEFLSYREMAMELPKYCKEMGFTHVEMMPVMEHPFYGSWGYQITGYFAPSSRFGTPQDFMFLVDSLHQEDIGVILDWVPSHFPEDQHGLGYFDGTHLYEYQDPRKGFHPDWKSLIFDFGRNEVRGFLISNALYWLDKYHIDALRVDAVASMLYLDYSRNEGEWIPNIYGGRENLEAISLLQEFNEAVHTYHPDVFTVAEESTAWPGVTHPVSAGGLGFDLKWMMGWMNDTLTYFQKESLYRSYHHRAISFSLIYAFTEKFVLPLSHDEVVYGKGSLVDKMPGDNWQQFANLRLLYTYMFGHPGAKMIFMGGEFGQRQEWKHDYSLDWHEMEYTAHKGIAFLVKDLNELYKNEPALYELNFSQKGFRWIDYHDHENSVLCWMRIGGEGTDLLIFAANFTPVVRKNYRIGVPAMGFYRECLNSDDLKYGGSDVLNIDELETAPIPLHGHTHSIPLTLPPLGITVMKFSRPYDKMW